MAAICAGAPEPSNQATGASATSRINPEGAIGTGNPGTLKGWVNTFYRHYRGKKLGPYHVRRWKVGRKLYKEYIKPDQVERVKAACQAHREKQKSKSEGARRTNHFLSNAAFMWNMITLWEKGKDSTPAQYAYLQRIDEEGMFITGRPGTRRRITRRLVKIAGKRFIVNTVFELDGTTKVFMVPFVVVNPVTERKNYFENLKRTLLGFAEKYHGKKSPPDQPSDPPNLWLPAH
jgi:hypothetical protein